MAVFYPFLSRAHTALADSKLGILIAAIAVGSTSFLVICLVSFHMVDSLHDGILQARATLTTTVHRVATKAKNAPLTAEANGSGIMAVQLLP